MPGHKVNIEARHTAGSAVSKGYVDDNYGVPAITFVLGGETDRRLIRRIGRESAMAMMKTLQASETDE